MYMCICVHAWDMDVCVQRPGEDVRCPPPITLTYSFKSEFLPEPSAPVFLAKMEARKHQQPSSCLSKSECLLRNHEDLGLDLSISVTSQPSRTQL